MIAALLFYQCNSHLILAFGSFLLLQLNWDVFPPTTFVFASHMMCMLPPEVKRSTRYIIQELVKYMTELAICVYSFVTYKASSKAFACMLVAIESLDEQDYVSDDAKKVLVSSRIV
jgi:hypothetical protein